MPFVAAESVVRGWLATHFTPTPVVTELPADLATLIPLIQVVRFGGGDDLPVLDTAHIDVDTFASTRDGARLLAEQVRAALRFQLPGQTAGGGFVAAVSTISAPRWVPYDNTTDLRRFVASYRITIRSVPIEGA